jgi:hypothetical protein
VSVKVRLAETIPHGLMRTAGAQLLDIEPAKLRFEEDVAISLLANPRSVLVNVPSLAVIDHFH